MANGILKANKLRQRLANTANLIEELSNLGWSRIMDNGLGHQKMGGQKHLANIVTDICLWYGMWDVFPISRMFKPSSGAAKIL